MQSEPTAVSEKTSFRDSPPANPSFTQHGNDSEAGPVSGLLQEKSGDPAAPDLSTIANSRAALSKSDLSDVASTPPSAQRVSQHENAGSPGKRRAEPGPPVVAGGLNQFPLETLPNGMQKQPRSLSVTVLSELTTMFRGSYPHIVALASSVSFGDHPGIPSVPCARDDPTCLENRFLAVLPRPSKCGGYALFGPG
jgi:hypothetical protein